MLKNKAEKLEFSSTSMSYPHVFHQITAISVIFKNLILSRSIQFHRIALGSVKLAVRKLSEKVDVLYAKSRTGIRALYPDSYESRMLFQGAD